MAIQFVRASVWAPGFGMSGGGSFDCTDCDFVVVWAGHNAANSVTIDTLNGVDGNNIGLVGLSPENHYTYLSGHWWLTPGSGTKTLVITWSGNGENRTAAIGYIGVKQGSDAVRQSKNGTAWGNSISVTPSTSVLPGNLVLDGVLTSYGSGTPGVGPDQTARVNESLGSQLRLHASEQLGSVSPATMSWTFSDSPKAAMWTIELQAGSSGNRAIIMFSKIQDFYDELKRGLIPPQELQKRYREVFI